MVFTCSARRRGGRRFKGDSLCRCHCRASPHESGKLSGRERSCRGSLQASPSRSVSPSSARSLVSSRLLLMREQRHISYLMVNGAPSVRSSVLRAESCLYRRRPETRAAAGQLKECPLSNCPHAVTYQCTASSRSVSREDSRVFFFTGTFDHRERVWTSDVVSGHGVVRSVHTVAWLTSAAFVSRPGLK